MLPIDQQWNGSGFIQNQLRLIWHMHKYCSRQHGIVRGEADTLEFSAQ
jgi:hypothetical protein